MSPRRLILVPFDYGQSDRTFYLPGNSSRFALLNTCSTVSAQSAITTDSMQVAPVIATDLRVIVTDLRVTVTDLGVVATVFLFNADLLLSKQ
ncbi:hypothetical protein IQ276_011425 [Desmonostoc muscorum LEGE 12446]|uniref:Uncharacterized protein n=1 Tax=Desmonostoc muscorum LEGE 12446 TaxID=1828758 RepID=A0A8J7DB45_DESMC|nr:hypothetical protein [Desmonostoc muscorum]MCF2147052.1 hypothetical protein [Desmonostoc muscorum LEGE 12446]